MSRVSLVSNASIRKLGYRFTRGEVRDDIPYAVALELRQDPRFRVEFDSADAVHKPLTADKPKTRQGRIAEIQRAIGLLDPTNPSHYTGDGVPSATAISSVLGWQVSAVERDEAVAEKTSSTKIIKSRNPRKSSEAPKESEKGDATVEDFKVGKTSKPAADADTEQPVKEAVKVHEDDDDDLPPTDEDMEASGIHLEDEDGGEPAGDAGEGSSEEGDGSGQEEAKDDEADTDKPEAEEAAKPRGKAAAKIKKGKPVIKLKKASEEEGGDPTTANAKEV